VRPIRPGGAAPASPRSGQLRAGARFSRPVRARHPRCIDAWDVSCTAFDLPTRVGYRKPRPDHPVARGAASAVA